MAAIKEHLIASQCFVNGFIKKLNYVPEEINFITSDKLTGVFNTTHTAITDKDLTNRLDLAALLDDAQVTSQYGIILPFENKTDYHYLLMFLTVNYTWKNRDSDIEYYVDAVKEPYLIHSKAIIKYIENADLHSDVINDIVFDLSVHGIDENELVNFYDNLRNKIRNNLIKASPYTLNGQPVGRIEFLSDSQ